MVLPLKKTLDWPWGGGGDPCLGGDAISANGSQAVRLSSLCFTVVLPEDGVMEQTDRLSNEDETDGEVNAFTLFISPSIRWCTMAPPVASWQFGAKKSGLLMLLWSVESEHGWSGVSPSSPGAATA